MFAEVLSESHSSANVTLVDPFAFCDAGSIEFRELAINAAPGATVQLRLVIPTLSRVAPEYVTVVFDECPPGTVEQITQSGDNTVCTPCEQGYYETEGACVKCSQGMKCGVAGIALKELQVSTAYWRADARSTQLYPCRLEGACKEGGAVGASACSLGYEGAACGSCVFPEYHLDRPSNACKPCGNDDVSFVLIAMILVSSLILSSAVYASYWAEQYFVKARASKTYRSLSFARLKIIWITTQIIGSVSSTLAIQFPSPFSQFIKIINFFILVRRRMLWYLN